MILIEKDSSSLKSTASSIACGAKLTTHELLNDKSSKFSHSPATKQQTNNGTALFGDSATCKTLSTLQNNNDDSIWTQHGHETDEWLEYERITLRFTKDENEN